MNRKSIRVCVCVCVLHAHMLFQASGPHLQNKIYTGGHLFPSGIGWAVTGRKRWVGLRERSLQGECIFPSGRGRCCGGAVRELVRGVGGLDSVACDFFDSVTLLG